MENTEISADVSLSFNESIITNTSMNTLVKEFVLIIPSEQWKTIVPIRKLYGRHYKHMLQSGWTDIIAEKAWQQQKFNCTIVFKNQRVCPSSSAKNYFNFSGICKDCNAKIKGKIIHQPRDNVDVEIHFRADNIIEEKHSNKNKRPRGLRRQTVISTLIDKKLDAVTFRRQEAKRLTNFDNIELSIIPNAAAIRKVKEQALRERHGFLFTNPSLNLLQSAKQGKYYGAIHNIGLLDFFCIYWSIEQQLLYRSRSKKNLTGFMTIDATGSIIKRNSNCEPPVFLYQCMFVNDDGSIPVFQMVSADHKAMQIAYFLQKIISAGNEPPRMVVCDFSWATLIAVAQVFAKCIDLRNYLKNCFNILHYFNNTLPSCFIRLDVSHFVSMISRWKCFKQKNKLVRQFYLRSLCQAYKMTSLEELRLFFEAIIVVALSEYVGFNKNGEELPSESRLQYLNNIIKCISVPEISNDETNENLNYNDIYDLQEVDVQDASDWVQWSTNIYDNAQQIIVNCTEGTTINAYYDPNFAQVLKIRLIPYLVLWSGVMQSHFQIATEISTSTSVEAEFAELKNRAFKGQLPMSADIFVHEHLDYIDGRIKLASYQKDVSSIDCEQLNNVTHNYSSASSIEIENFVENCFSSDAINYDIGEDIYIQNVNESSIVNDDTVDKQDQLNCNTYENSRGLVCKSSKEEQCSAVKKQYKPSYLDKCPEWDYIKLARNQNISLMRNGNVCKSVIIDGKVFTISQTCSFDAIFHLIANSIATIKSYKKKIETTNNRTINLVTSILYSGKITKNHYSERAKILIELPLFNDSVTMYRSTIFKLNAKCNVVNLINYLFANIPSCRVTITCSCGYLQTRQIVELNINVDPLLYKGLQYMQEAIDTSTIKITCRKCSSIATENIEYGPHLFIDTTIFTDARYTKRDETIIHTIESIATTITLNCQTYILVGVINYINSSGSKDDGHYVTYARCGNYWYEYDDLKRKRNIANKKTKITPHLIFYIKET